MGGSISIMSFFGKPATGFSTPNIASSPKISKKINKSKDNPKLAQAIPPKDKLPKKVFLLQNLDSLFTDLDGDREKDPSTLCK
jgi:hypothetical protein